MLKRFGKIIAMILVFSCCFTVCGYATAEKPELEDCTLTKTEFDQLEHTYAVYSESTARASDLITGHSLGIAKNGTNTLCINGATECAETVKKCGFKTLTIQRRSSSTDSWSDYAEYESLFIEETSYLLSKSVTVDTGYQYRVVGKHYAYKTFFSTQTLEATTSYIQF